MLAFANHKGGCAKTTTVANLGAAFAERGRRTLLIDTDPQGQFIGDALAVLHHSRGRLREARPAS